MNEIQNIGLNEKNKKPCEILIKWCIKKKIIVIPRSNNFENLSTNFLTCKDDWMLCDNDITLIDNIPQKSKGHCLQSVFEKNCGINLWEPLILHNSQSHNENKILNLINGNLSCIIVNNVLTVNNCSNILTKMEDANLIQNQSPYDNYGINFRKNEIGISIDDMLWRDNSEKYFNECIKVNNLFDNLFDNNLNPFKIMIETLKKVIGDDYILERMTSQVDFTEQSSVTSTCDLVGEPVGSTNNGIQCPQGVFRIFSPSSQEFPYHTDGFNYGKILNSAENININLFPTIMNANTNQVIAIILVLQQTNNNKNEIDLHNCLVDDLELFKDEIGMYSHWMGTKYKNINSLESKLQDKQFFSPILNTGDLYIFSASRIHKLNNLIEQNNRIVLATFGCVKDNKIILYQ